MSGAPDTLRNTPPRPNAHFAPGRKRRGMSTQPSKARVLVVEDDDLLRGIMCDFLRHDGYSVESAENGARGLELIRQSHPDLILLNCMMPVMDGLSVLFQLQSQPPEKPFRVIFYTSYEKKDIFQTAKDLGAHAVIQTPRNPQQLLTVVKKVLAGVEMIDVPAPFPPAPTVPATLPEFERMFSAGVCKGRILLVEDVTDIRDIIANCLRQQGYFVREAGDGVECLKLAKTMRPDVILLNYLMPKMDGLAALRQLKMNPVISYLKVITYSAVTDFSGFQAASLEAGAVDCLQSPFELRALLKAMEKALRYH